MDKNVKGPKIMRAFKIHFLNSYIWNNLSPSSFLCSTKCSKSHSNQFPQTLRTFGTKKVSFEKSCYVNHYEISESCFKFQWQKITLC